MYPRPEIKKASIENLDQSKAKGDAANVDKIEFPFNPKKITIKRGSSFKEASGKTGGDWTGLTWDGTSADTLSMEFYLDTTEPEIKLSKDGMKAAISQMLPILPISPFMDPAADGAKDPMLMLLTNGDSLTEKINAIYSLTMILDSKEGSDQTLRRPCLVKFSWGDPTSGVHFAGGIQDFEFTYVLFDSDGSPKRAEVSMTLIGRYLRKSADLPSEHGPALLAPQETKKSSNVKA